ncbi:MAG: VOC family protein [Cohaesibacteraceae bacterium]|nr:VOC family protein [Cohaesibacteraceae bacterium]MBL4875208.1 VOC family protein [Cohaesibacteraceae bacterium]
MSRGFDHLVLPVHDLDCARRFYEKLGFTTTPVGYHAFGTSNFLVQMNGVFLEIITVHDALLIPPDKTRAFSFPGFVQKFLAGQEGFGMLVLRSEDAAADIEQWRELGLQTYEKFDFERIATDQTGIDRKVAFSLAFTASEFINEAGFFTCQQHYPENFWKAEFQSHENQSTHISSVFMSAESPADHHEFLGGFTGQREMNATSLGISMDCDGSDLRVLSPLACESLFGISPVDSKSRLFGYSIVVPDLEKLKNILGQNDIQFSMRHEQAIISPEVAFGVTLVFEQS